MLKAVAIRANAQGVLEVAVNVVHATTHFILTTTS